MAFVNAVVRLREAFEHASERHARRGTFSTTNLLRGVAGNSRDNIGEDIEAFRRSALGQYIRDSLHASLREESPLVRNSAAKALIAAYLIVRAGIPQRSSPFEPGALVMSSVQLPSSAGLNLGWEHFARAYASEQKGIYRQKRTGTIEHAIIPTAEDVQIRDEERAAYQRACGFEARYKEFLKKPNGDFVDAIQFLAGDVHREDVLREELIRPLEISDLLPDDSSLSIVAVDIPGAGSINGFAGFSRTNEILQHIASSDSRRELGARQLVISSGGATFIIVPHEVSIQALNRYSEDVQRFTRGVLFSQQHLDNETQERMVTDYVCRLFIRSMTSVLRENPAASLTELSAKRPSEFALGSVSVQLLPNVQVARNERFGDLLDRVRMNLER